MPSPSKRLSGILPSGKDGWEVHFAASTRKQAGEPIIMLSVGDHDFDTPNETVEACVTAVRGGHHHYTQLAGRAAAARGDGARLDPLHRRRDQRGRSDRSAGRPACALCRRAGYARQGRPCGRRRALLRDLSGNVPGGRSGFHRGRGRSAGMASSRAPKRSGPHSGRTRAPSSSTRPTTRPAPSIRARASKASPGSAVEHDLWLLSDEVYWTLAEGHHVSPRALPGMAERTLVINSMSKSHGMTGWRIGWLTGPEAMISLLVSLNLVTTYGLTDFVQQAAAEALENGYGVKMIADIYNGAAQAVPRCDPRAERHHRARLGGRHVRHARHLAPSSRTTRSSPGHCSTRKASASCPDRASATRPPGISASASASRTTCCWMPQRDFAVSRPPTEARRPDS